MATKSNPISKVLTILIMTHLMRLQYAPKVQSKVMLPLSETARVASRQYKMTYSQQPRHSPRRGRCNRKMRIMSRCFSTSLALAALLALAPAPSSWAGDLKITLPKHSELTPVQKLNREGVEAVQKHQYEKAETLFLKAYL